MHEVLDHPPSRVSFDELLYQAESDSVDWDEPWRHYEGALNSFGYKMFWFDCPGIRENSPTCHSANDLPPPLDPFSPLDGEALAAYPLGHYPIREAFRQPNVHPAYDRFDRRVVIKATRSSSSEVKIATYLASQRRCHPDPRDHTIPFLDIIKVGEWAFLVMPEWSTRGSPYNVGEYAEWFEHLLEGIVYLHEHLIAFRDVSQSNILWNYGGDYASYIGKPFASSFDVRYAYIDFGQSTQFSIDSSLEARKVTGTVHTPGVAPPELSETKTYDPFAVDIFALGKCMQIYLEAHQGVSPVPMVLWHTMPGFSDLVARMTNPDPSRRPTASRALQKLRELIAATPQEVLRAPGCHWIWHRLAERSDHCAPAPRAGPTTTDHDIQAWRWTAPDV